MASAFTINFPYNDSTYTAVISQVNDSINIYIPDETLHSIIPQGKISIDPQLVKSDALQLNSLQNLIVTILGVIEEKHHGSSDHRK